jgi:hypothetical protein
MVDFARGIMAALSGTTTGLAEGAEAEDKKRQDFTKIGITQRLKNIDTALKLQKEQQAKRREQDTFVETFAGKFGFPDRVSGKIMPLSEAQAMDLYNLSNGDAAKAIELITKNEITFAGTGKVKDIAPLPGLADDTTKAFEEMDTEKKGIFSTGRYSSVAESVNKEIAAMGQPDKIEIPQLRKAVETGMQIAEKSDPKVHKAGTWTWKDANGKAKNAPGFIATNGDRLYTSSKNEQLVPPEGATFQPYSTRTETIKPMDEQYLTIDDKLRTSEFAKAQETVRTSEIGLRDMRTTYEAMAPYAMDKTVYSTAVKTVGGFLKKADVEIFGIKFMFGSDREYDPSSNISTLEKYIEENKGAEDVAVKANVLAAMQLRSAYAFLQAEGDTRPSDADIKRAIEQFSAKDPMEFLEKAQANWTMAVDKATNIHDAYIKQSSVVTAKNLLSRTDINTAPYQMWLDNNVMPTPSSEPPSFLTVDESGKVVITDEARTQAKGVVAPTTEQEAGLPADGVPVTLTNGVSATIKDGKVYVAGATKEVTVAQAIKAGLLDKDAVAKQQ